MAKLLLGSVSEVNAAALPEDVHATQRMAVSYNVRIEYSCTLTPSTSPG